MDNLQWKISSFCNWPRNNLSRPGGQKNYTPPKKNLSSPPPPSLNGRSFNKVCPAWLAQYRKPKWKSEMKIRNVHTQLPTLWATKHKHKFPKQTLLIQDCLFCQKGTATYISSEIVPVAFLNLFQCAKYRYWGGRASPVELLRGPLPPQFLYTPILYSTKEVTFLLQNAPPFSPEHYYLIL